MLSVLSIPWDIFFVKSLWSIRNVSASRFMFKVNNKSTRLTMCSKLIIKTLEIKTLSLIRPLNYWLWVTLLHHTSIFWLTCGSLLLGKVMLDMKFWICFVLSKLKLHVCSKFKLICCVNFLSIFPHRM